MMQAFRYELDPNNAARSALSSHCGAARFAVAVIGGELASKLAKAIPVKLSSARDLADPGFLKNFAHQQSIFFLYGNAVAALKNLYRKTDSEKAASAAAAEQAVSAINSVSAQSFLASGRGMAMFPRGMDQPRRRVLDKIISIIANGLIQIIYDTTPKK